MKSLLLANKSSLVPMLSLWDYSILADTRSVYIYCWSMNPAAQEQEYTYINCGDASTVCLPFKKSKVLSSSCARLFPSAKLTINK